VHDLMEVKKFLSMSANQRKAVIERRNFNEKPAPAVKEKAAKTAAEAKPNEDLPKE